MFSYITESGMNKLLKKISKHKREVISESVWNTAIGFMIAYSFTVGLGPYILGAGITHETSLTWTLAMTVVSVARGYIIRLYFSRKRYIKTLRTEMFFLKRKLRKHKGMEMLSKDDSDKLLRSITKAAKKGKKNG